MKENQKKVKSSEWNKGLRKYNCCPPTARGDTFPSFPEDEENSTDVAPTLSGENINTMTLSPSFIKHPTLFTTAPPTSDPDAEVCSGRPFNSFMQLKNGSLYAFRGEWCKAHDFNIQNQNPHIVVV